MFANKCILSRQLLTFRHPAPMHDMSVNELAVNGLEETVDLKVVNGMESV